MRRTGPPHNDAPLASCEHGFSEGGLTRPLSFGFRCSPFSLLAVSALFSALLSPPSSFASLAHDHQPRHRPRPAVASAMKIRRKSEKTVQSLDGVPPLHTLITCTYQKLFKKDGLMLVGGHPADNNGAPTSGNGVLLPGHGTSDQKSHRHERGSSWRVRGFDDEQEARLETHLGVAHEASRHGDGHESPTRDLHEARTNPLLPKRRKVKSTRYAEFPDEMGNVTPHSTKAEKRSRNIEKGSFTAEDTADYINTVANSKEALIASIFYVFDTLGKSGLTASEVVAIMLDQNLPGLKEGGARHTVQVANVLRRSRHFISIGNKQYLPCAVAEDPSRKHGRHGQGSKSKPGRVVCKLYDGSGWFCPREAQAGFSLCVHHLDMINRPLGHCKAQTPSPIRDSPTHAASLPSPREADQESDSEREDSDDIGPALAKWGRDRTPGSVPNQKRKMLSLCSIK